LSVTDQSGQFQHGIQGGDLIERPVHRRLVRLVRHQHHRDRLARRPAALQHALEADARVAQRCRHVGDHTGPVHHHQPQVVGADMGGHRHGRQVGEHRRLGAPNRRGPTTPQVDQVRDHCARRRAGTGAPALQHHPANEIALRHHGVEHAVDPGDRRGLRHHAGMHPALDPDVGPPRDAQQLDAIAELIGERDIERRDSADALYVHRGEIDRTVECQRR